MHRFSTFALILLLHGQGVATPSYLEEFRRLHECEHVDTAVVKVSYSSDGSTRRFTKREAIESYQRQRQQLRLTITLSSSKRLLDLNVNRANAVSDGAWIVEHFGNKKQESSFQDEGCHYVGTFQNGGIVSLHICDGEVVAGAHDGVHEYVIYPHPLPQDIHSIDKNRSRSRSQPGGNRTSADDENTPGNNKTSDETKNTISPEAIVRSAGDDSLSSRDDGMSVEDVRTLRGGGRVMIAWRKYDSQSLRRDFQGVEVLPAPARSRREAVDQKGVDADGVRHVTAEFALILDELFMNSQKERLGIRTIKDILNLLVVKFNGVQAIYGNLAAVGVVMNIVVSRLDMFWKDPDWYRNISDFDINQLARAAHATQHFPGNVTQFYDVVGLNTQRAPGPPGVAFVGTICHPNWKTYANKMTGTFWLGDAHEFGHTLGLNHDWDYGTCGPVGGLMGSNPLLFLDCYKKVLVRRFNEGHMSCLFNITAPSGPIFQLMKTFPVLSQGLDKICETDFIYGSEALRPLHEGPCHSIVCGVLNPRDEYFGVANSLGDGSGIYMGRICGPNKVCHGGECREPDMKRTTTISTDDYYAKLRIGGWSEWSSYSDMCSTGCGTGLRVASRTCTRPPPVMEYCPGSKFKAALCNMKPCPGDELKSEWDLKLDRAAYMCGWLIRRFVLNGTKYIAKGDIANDRGDAAAQCTIGCRQAEKPNAGSHSPMAIQPDGTICGNRMRDFYLYGVQYRCMRGLCTGFDCKGRSVDGRDDPVFPDACGVCGGDNSSCTFGTTTFELNKGEREDLVKLPVGTRDIFVGFEFRNQQPFAIELFSKDGQAVIQYSNGERRVHDNRRNPENFAGTYWTYIHEVQVLSTSGPLTQPVILKLNYIGETNAIQTVTWHYKKPAYVSTVACNNGTSSLGGCTCAPNFYGASCDKKCGVLCRNGGYMKGDECWSCTCNAFSEWRLCERCRKGRMGPDCRECEIARCYNGGTLDTTFCNCTCPAGFNGTDCSACVTKSRSNYGGGWMDYMPAVLLPRAFLGPQSGSPCIIYNGSLVFNVVSLVIGCMLLLSGFQV